MCTGCPQDIQSVTSSAAVCILTNNTYNYSYKYKKKQKLLNQILKWKKKKKKNRPTIELLHVLLLLLLLVLLQPTINVPKKKANLLLRLPLRLLILLLNLSVLLQPTIEVPKRKKKKNQLILRPTDLLLLPLFLVTMAIYTVDAKELEGIILCFQAHPNTSFPILHHTLNSVYGVDLYETQFHFLCHNVPTNRLTELYKDAPKQLLNHMIIHIQTESVCRNKK